MNEGDQSSNDIDEEEKKLKAKYGQDLKAKKPKKERKVLFKQEEFDSATHEMEKQKNAMINQGGADSMPKFGSS